MGRDVVLYDASRQIDEDVEDQQEYDEVTETVLIAEPAGYKGLQEE